MVFQKIYNWWFGSKKLTKPIVITTPIVINKAPTPMIINKAPTPYFPHPSPPPYN